MDFNEKQRRTDKLAREVLELNRGSLILKLRFLDTALSRLPLTPWPGTFLATDGRRLLYDARHILRVYAREQAASVRDYLHVVLHCVFRHMYIHTLADPLAWDLACDIAVENVISSLDLPSLNAQRVREQRTEELKKEVGSLTAERIYRYYLDRHLPAEELMALRLPFLADDHLPWYSTDEEESSPEDRRDMPPGQLPSRRNGEEHTALRDPDREEISEEDWREEAKRLELELTTMERERYGSKAGALVQNLREVNRERVDYAAFLRRFAVHGEVLRINDEEFDYVFYTYGLKLYKNLPLVEPLEYKEVRRIREFVIAIDTSGSTTGDLVQSFVQKTYNILLSTESFYSSVNIHIIQCDAEIQEHVVITRAEEFREYLKTMKLRGHGGTDFRPVFQLVDRLKKDRAFTNLRGLLYFTDGHGTFPSRKPDYETAFVFVDAEDTPPAVPPWAIRLVLRPEEITAIPE